MEKKKEIGAEIQESRLEKIEENNKDILEGQRKQEQKNEGVSEKSKRKNNKRERKEYTL